MASSQRQSWRQESPETKGSEVKLLLSRRNVTGRGVDVVDYPDEDSKVSLSQLYTIHGLRIREAT
jgi:hypothetical protein